MVTSGTDEALAGRAAGGDLDAFEELLARYRDRVFRICLRCAGNHEDAEDWAQECLVRVFRQLHRYQPTRPFTPWLLRVVANTCVNLGKARLRRHGRLQLGLDDGLPIACRAPGPAARAIAAGDQRDALRAVDDLPPEMRVAVILRVLEELTFRELGEALGVPLPTAASRVRRALQRTRTALRAASDRASGERGFGQR